MTPDARPEIVADKLHSAAIHLLRRVRRQDPHSGLSAARLSALSVIVFTGPLSMSELAAAEQVRLPTMSRLVSALEYEGLVERVADPNDRRSVQVLATAAGEQLLEEARGRRIHDLAQRLARLAPNDLATLDRAAELIENL